YAPLIKRMKSYCPFTEEQEKRFISIVTYRKIPKGDFIVRAGNRSDQIGYLLKGIIRYYYIDEEGKEFTRHFCREGNFVSSYISLIKNEPSTYSIAALSDLELLSFSYKDWTEFVADYPDLLTIMVSLLQESQLIAEERERSLILDSPSTRYLNLLKTHRQIEKMVKQYDLASYLGITAVALSRIRRRLMKEGKIPEINPG
ncbi:MAG: Crp/Fnr family transcriptional regulator, partial [Spirochaetales bacterium]|nr:Crp/Fnr family transcriptional regulator [Spirochaetales bacterium]